MSTQSASCESLASEGRLRGAKPRSGETTFAVIGEKQGDRGRIPLRPSLSQYLCSLVRVAVIALSCGVVAALAHVTFFFLLARAPAQAAKGAALELARLDDKLQSALSELQSSNNNLVLLLDDLELLRGRLTAASQSAVLREEDLDGLRIRLQKETQEAQRAVSRTIELEQEVARLTKELLGISIVAEELKGRLRDLDAQTQDPNAAGKDLQDIVQDQNRQFVVKHSEIIGARIHTPQGESLGNIEDLLLEPSFGEVEYAVISLSAFPDMNNRLFVVPWSALTSSRGSDGNGLQFRLKLDKEKLKMAPGFPKDNWPDINSRQFSKPIEDFYTATIARDRHRAVPAGSRVSSLHLVKASDVKGCDVDTSEGRDAGEITDVAIDPNRGRVVFLVLSEGGFLGFGTAKYLVPWQAASFSTGENKDLYCKLNALRATFENAPAFNDDDWKRMSDPRYIERAYSYYGYPTYWKETVEAGAGKH